MEKLPSKGISTPIAIGIIIVALIGAGTLGYWWLSAKRYISCSDWYHLIEETFNEANFCETDKDCKAVKLGSSYFDFGCFKYVNVNTNVEKIMEELFNYTQRCSHAINECAPAPEPSCVNQKCVFVEKEEKEVENGTEKIGKLRDWKTYRNEKYEFEFKYPAIPTGCENCTINETSESFSVNRTSLTIIDAEGLTLAEFVDEKTKEIQVTERKKVMISGEEGVSIEYRFGGSSRFGKATFVKKNNNIFTFEFSAGVFCCGPKVDEIYELTVYEAMLSTFYFIEELDITNWESYRNEEYGFELKYPKAWIYQERPSSISFAADPSDLPLPGTGLLPLISVSIRESSEDSERTCCLKKMIKEKIIINGKEAIRVTLLPGRGDDYLGEVKFVSVEFPIGGTDKFIVFENINDYYVKEFNQILSTFSFINSVADYLREAQLQYEGEIQKDNIITALNDILNLSAEELMEKKYKDYTGKENQWDLATLIYRHFIPKSPGTTLGDDFFHDLKSAKVQVQVREILDDIL